MDRLRTEILREHLHVALEPAARDENRAGLDLCEPTIDTANDHTPGTAVPAGEQMNGGGLIEELDAQSLCLPREHVDEPFTTTDRQQPGTGLGHEDRRETSQPDPQSLQPVHCLRDIRGQMTDVFRVAPSTREAEHVLDEVLSDGVRIIEAHIRCGPSGVTTTFLLGCALENSYPKLRMGLRRSDRGGEPGHAAPDYHEIEPHASSRVRHQPPYP